MRLPDDDLEYLRAEAAEHALVYRLGETPSDHDMIAVALAELQAARKIVAAIAGDLQPLQHFDGGYHEGCIYCAGGNGASYPVNYVQVGVGWQRGWHDPECPWLLARALVAGKETTDVS